MGDVSDDIAQEVAKEMGLEGKTADDLVDKVIGPYKIGWVFVDDNTHGHSVSLYLSYIFFSFQYQ